VILAAAAVARLWGIGFCFPHTHCRPDEDAISAIVGGFSSGDFNPHVFNYPALFMLVVASLLGITVNAERLLHRVVPFHFDSLLGGVSIRRRRSCQRLGHFPHRAPSLRSPFGGRRRGAPVGGLPARS
jgi:hypothetical protein